MAQPLKALAILVATALVGSVIAMVSHVPASAYVVPSVHIATADQPVRFTPQELGAQRTSSGLQVDDAKLEEAVSKLDALYARPSQPGSYELTDGGVLLNEGTSGWSLDRAAAKAMLIDALRGKGSDHALPLVEVPAPPPPEKAIVVKLSEFRLELYERTKLAQHYVVGIGELRFPTPPGVYHVRSKAKNPTWRNPGSAWARSMPSYIGPGPRNPLGTRALRLDREAIVIHGTPNPSSVGRRSSHGCIRMRKADVEALFEMVPVDTPVFIVP